MVELLQSLFDAIKAPFALFGDIIGYIRYFIRYIIQAFQSVTSLFSAVTGLPAIVLLLLTFAFTFGIIRLVINRRE